MGKGVQHFSGGSNLFQGESNFFQGGGVGGGGSKCLF